MKISEVMAVLKLMQDNLGDVECCLYLDQWDGQKGLSTIEKIDVKPFKKHFAVLLDWRME